MLRTDLKIFKAERMTQQADAGGQRTANEVQNGQLNEVFGNISDIDHAQSAVDIATIYPAVSTADTQLLQDGHILINEPPLDPLVDVMIIEAAAVNDGSTRADIIEAIEGGVIAGMSLRKGLSAMITGQDAIASVDLNGTLAAYDEERRINVFVGQRVVIAVEYTGAEDAAYPRFQHFCEITEVPTAVYNPFGGSTVTGNYRFNPPIPYNTPGRDQNINGETRCTLLRAAITGNAVTAHGVTQLTAAAASNTLSVAKTTGLLMPRITETADRPNNSPFTAEDSGLQRKAILEPATTGKAYSISIFDFADIPGNGFNILYQSGGKNRYGYNEEYSNNLLSFNLQYVPDAGSNISISYYSSDRYQSYNSANALPADYAIISSTVEGSLYFAATATRYTFRRNSVDPRILEAARENTGYMQSAILETDGSITYYNGWSAIEYNAIVENQIAAGITASAAEFVLAYAEVVLETLYIVVEKSTGGLFTASADNAGVITGVGVTGSVSNGLVAVTFDSPVKLDTLRYDVAEVITLTPPPELYGLDPLRISNGGRVPFFRPFGVICVAHNQYEQYPALTAAQTIARRPNSFIDIVDNLGASLWHPLNTHYEYDKATGEVTIIDVTGFTAPYELIDTLSELTLVTGVTDNTLKIRAPMVGSFPAGSIVSSVYQLGDLQARTTNMFDQNTWDGTWADVIKGDPATANYNAINYPIEVANQSAVNEQWAIIFTSDTAFRCVGKNVGQVATGDILNDFSPLNPATNQPFFIIRNSGWGGGWQPGNVLRFNTVAASKPAVLLRSVSAGHSAIEQDSIRLHFRGNAE